LPTFPCFGKSRRLASCLRAYLKNYAFFIANSSLYRKQYHTKDNEDRATNNTPGEPFNALQKGSSQQLPSHLNI
jgi:hypothetical protein